MFFFSYKTDVFNIYLFKRCLIPRNVYSIALNTLSFLDKHSFDFNKVTRSHWYANVLLFSVSETVSPMRIWTKLMQFANNYYRVSSIMSKLFDYRLSNFECFILFSCFGDRLEKVIFGITAQVTSTAISIAENELISIDLLPLNKNRPFSEMHRLIIIHVLSRRFANIHFSIVNEQVWRKYCSIFKRR